MKINILLPYKEKFDVNKASSVSITVKNNLLYTSFLNEIKIYGQYVEEPLFKNNFFGFKYSILSMKSKNSFLADKMSGIISKSSDKKQLIEIHNRPYLLDQVSRSNKFPISLFFHNDPQKMKGAMTIKDREKILKKCIAVFCVSEYIKKQFLCGINENKNRVYVLHNGVERRLKKQPFKKKEVLFVGRIVLEKGVDMYVNSISSIASCFPDWSFGLIGSFKLGEESNKDVFSSKLIEKFKKIGSNVKFYGFQNQKFVQKKMKTTSIIVIPSIWEEPFGLVAAEAMSYGIAIIASNVGAIPEIIEKNGVLIDAINSKKIENVLIDLIKNPKKLKKFQKKSWDNFKFSAKKSSKTLDYHRDLIFKWTDL